MSHSSDRQLESKCTASQQSEPFEAFRPLLFSIAYRMLGSVAEAEDAVQDAYLRYRSTPPADIRSPKALLSTIVTRLCLDRLKSARARRETYIGPWLPEPVVTSPQEQDMPAAILGDRESVSLAFLVLLEKLTPVERAVFLLREVFDYEYPEIAAIVGRSEAACRQTFHRAKQHIVANRPRFSSTPAERERLTLAFLRAAEQGDLQGIVSLLHEDAVLWSDGGGKRPAALRPIVGRDRIERGLIGLFRQHREEVPSGEIVQVNGQIGLRLHTSQGIWGIVTFETDAGRIRELRLVLNPDKLRGV